MSSMREVVHASSCESFIVVVNRDGFFVDVFEDTPAGRESLSQLLESDKTLRTANILEEPASQSDGLPQFVLRIDPREPRSVLHTAENVSALNANRVTATVDALEDTVASMNRTKLALERPKPPVVVEPGATLPRAAARGSQPPAGKLNVDLVTERNGRRLLQEIRYIREVVRRGELVEMDVWFGESGRIKDITFGGPDARLLHRQRMARRHPEWRLGTFSIERPVDAAPRWKYSLPAMPEAAGPRLAMPNIEHQAEVILQWLRDNVSIN
jgi:hypothetical protein